jgi:hypothetical protein
LPSSIGSCADKLMLRTRPLSGQLMPPHEQGDASEAFQSSRRGEMVVKALLNSINAKPSGAKPTAMPTTHASKVTRTKFHLGSCVSESMLAIEPRTSPIVYLSRNGSVQSWCIYIYHQKCSANVLLDPHVLLPASHQLPHSQTAYVQRSRKMSSICSKNSSALLVIYTEP